jgi:integral membrane protein
MKTPIARLRTVGIYEGISFLVLLGIAMPVKYILGIPELVKYVGWAHGVLFILYIAAVVHAYIAYQWSALKVALALMASLVPFGPFLFDKRLRKDEKALALQPEKVIR